MKGQFWGVRGSIPVPGKSTMKYGGNTTCFELKTSNGEEIIIDAGTGIYNLGKKLIAEADNFTIHLFLTHFHWDHIQGLPFFAPFFDKRFNVKIYYYGINGTEGRDVLESQLNPKFFPVTCSVFSAKVDFIKINEKEKIVIDGIEIIKTLNHHSSGTVSYRFNENGKSLVFMTDNELFCSKEENHPTMDSMKRLNAQLIDFVKEADILIHDTQYFESDFPEKVGWGHSNNASVAYFSEASKVKNLFITHYDPDYSDDLIDKLISETRIIIANELNSTIEAQAAYEGLEILL